MAQIFDRITVNPQQAETEVADLIVAEGVRVHVHLQHLAPALPSTRGRSGRTLQTRVSPLPLVGFGLIESMDAPVPRNDQDAS